MTNRTRVVDELSHTPIFRSLPRPLLQKVARVVDETQVRAGRSVVEERTYRSGGGPAFYLIVSGEADVTIRGKRLRKLRPGESFGELSLLDGKPRSATVKAGTDLTLYRIRAWDFQALLKSEPAIALALLKDLAARIREMTETATSARRR